MDQTPRFPFEYVAYAETSKIAADLANSAPADRSILVDAFAGAGGNTIAFAKSGKWKRVYAIEKNPAVLQCAKHNAKIYGVDDKITWFEGDCFEILKKQLKDLAPYSVIFASPPWGGLSPFIWPCEIVKISNCDRCWISVG